jgi:hypothetical protein
MKFVYDDGGRAAAGFKGTTGDCAVRAIAIATGKPYQEVYDAINKLGSRERTGRRKRSKSNARTGVFGKCVRRYMASIGWVWTPTMTIGSGCTVHLRDGELPTGRVICVVSKHYCAVINGKVHDTYDPQREVHAVRVDNGEELKPHERRVKNAFRVEGIQRDGIATIQRRCVYGYWTPPAPTRMMDFT